MKTTWPKRPLYNPFGENIAYERIVTDDHGGEWKFVRMPCHCPCHKNPAFKHVRPCCEDGMIVYPVQVRQPLDA
jgi:hypothetical protein